MGTRATVVTLLSSFGSIATILMWFNVSPETFGESVYELLRLLAPFIMVVLGFTAGWFANAAISARRAARMSSEEAKRELFALNVRSAPDWWKCILYALTSKGEVCVRRVYWKSHENRATSNIEGLVDQSVDGDIVRLTPNDAAMAAANVISGELACYTDKDIALHAVYDPERKAVPSTTFMAISDGLADWWWYTDDEDLTKVKEFTGLSDLWTT